jgi:hypothetical protein
MCPNIMRLLTHCSISLLLLPILLTACDSPEKTADCKEYAQAIKKIGQKAAENLQVVSVQSGYGAFYGSMADGEEQNAQIFKSMKLNNPRVKQIQSNIVKANVEITQNWRDQAKVIESLPVNSSRSVRDAALQPLMPNQSVALEKLYTQFELMGKYCKRKK